MSAIHSPNITASDEYEDKRITLAIGEVIGKEMLKNADECNEFVPDVPIVSIGSIQRT